MENRIEYNGVGPIIRAGELADAVVDAIAEDNPDKEVDVSDRGDYLRIHTDRRCLLTQATLEKHLGYPFDITLLEREMPSFTGRMKTVNQQFLWYYET
ncbi:MAG: monooxygenase [Gammaproteobacteria bacterium]|nr:monooxygenase [Gammaproteobacteria bacterium]